MTVYEYLFAITSVSILPLVGFYGHFYLKKKFEILAEKSELMEINQKLEEIKLINSVKSSRQIDLYKHGLNSFFELLELATEINYKISMANYGAAYDSIDSESNLINEINTSLSIKINKFNTNYSIVKGIFHDYDEILSELDSLFYLTAHSYILFSDLYMFLFHHSVPKFEHIANSTIRTYFEELSKGNLDYQMPKKTWYFNQVKELVELTIDFNNSINNHTTTIINLLLKTME